MENILCRAMRFNIDIYPHEGWRGSVGVLRTSDETSKRQMSGRERYTSKLIVSFSLAFFIIKITTECVKKSEVKPPPVINSVRSTSKIFRN